MSVSVHPPFTYEFAPKFNRRSMPPTQSPPPPPTHSQNKRLSHKAPAVPDRTSSLVYLPELFNSINSEHNTPLANITSPPLSKASAAAGRQDMIPLCEIPEELDQDIGPAPAPVTHGVPSWHDHAAQLQKIMATVMEQNRMLAEQLVDADRRARMWQSQFTEAQEKLSSVTEKCHNAEQELDVTRRMLKESEHVRNYWNLKLPAVDEAAETQSIKTVEPESSSSTSLPANFIRFMKKTPV